MFLTLYELGIAIFEFFSVFFDWLFIPLRIYMPQLYMLDQVSDLAGNDDFLGNVTFGFLAYTEVVFGNFIVDDYYLQFRPIDCFLGFCGVLIVYRIIKWVLDIVL